MRIMVAVAIMISIGSSFLVQASMANVEREVWLLGNLSEDNDRDEVGLCVSSMTSASSLSFDVSIGERYQGVDIFSRDGDAPIFSLKEFYIDIRGIRTGKQFFESNDIEFDFITLDPFETRDLSVPFSALEKNKKLGNWGVSSRFMNERLEAMFLFHEPPVLAIDSSSPWTRELQQGLHYGDVKSEADYSLGMRWADKLSIVDYNLFAQYGSGNSPVDVEINQFGRVRPIISEQFSAGGALQFPLWGNTVRVGSASYFQSGYSDFTIGIIEIERIWENVVAHSDSLFLNIGIADVWETESGNGIPELDMRRIYEGETLLGTVEYAIDDWLFKIKGAYNFEHEGVYVAPEVVWRAEWLDISLKYEFIEGDSSNMSSLDNIWSAHAGDDNLSLRLIFYF